MEELDCLELMKQNTSYVAEEKTWYTSLLFKENPDSLETNLPAARAVLYKIEDSAIKEGKVDVLNKAYQEMIDGGFAEKVPPEEIDIERGQGHYLQCHPVYKENRATMKCRVVMNAAAKSKGGKSLNQYLHQGPCYLEDFIQILLRFRLYFYCFCSDISSMFLRIKLIHGKDYLRFLWRGCNKKIPPEVWRMISVTFGIVTSPFQSIYIVKRHAELFEQLYSLANKVIENSLYMDDVASGTFEKSVAIQTVEEIYKLLLEANMKSHKYSSNNVEVLSTIPPECKNPEPTVKILGVQWNTIEDCLNFNFTEKMDKDKMDTKRTFLQQAARVFDPCGLIAPITATVKILFQQVWLLKMTWDDVLPAEIQTKWNKWKEEICSISDMEIQ